MNKKILILNILLLIASLLPVNIFSMHFESIKDFDLKKNKPVAKLSIRENEDKLVGVLTSRFVLPAKFYGEVIQDQSGDYTFYIERIKYITSWPNGWTHGENEASGIIKFEKKKNMYIAKISEEVEIWELTKGEIRYYDDYFRRKKGLQKVKERLTRIKAVTGFVKEQNLLAEYYGNVWFKTIYGEPFGRVLKKYLLDKKTVFPESLSGLKNSESLKRDLEASIELFFMEYNMHYFLYNILDKSEFELLN